MRRAAPTNVLCNMHKAEYLGTVGDDAYDQEIVNGLPRILSPYYREARKRARRWLSEQPDRDLIRFSVERTLKMSTYKTMRSGEERSDADCDVFSDACERAAIVQSDFVYRVHEELDRVYDETFGDPGPRLKLECE